MRKTLSLSTHLGINREVLEEKGILDITLGLDTPYFVDPRLFFSRKLSGNFLDSDKKIIDYFSLIIKIIKNSKNSPQLQNKAIGMIAIKEPVGLSIGYGSKRDSGTSTSEAIARKIIFTITELISVGLEDPELLELMLLFVEGYGPDSMSDLVIHIIYQDLCKFTQDACIELNIKTQEYIINGDMYKMPPHPFKAHQIVFVPLDFISSLPVAYDWEGVKEAAAYNDALRNELSKVFFPLIKEEIVKINSMNEKEKNDFKIRFAKLLDIYKQTKPKGYDRESDPGGYYLLRNIIEKYAKEFTSKKEIVTEPERVINIVRGIILSYKRNIEEIGWNKNLYHRTKTNEILKDQPHHEDVAQLLFNGLADVHCSYTNIMLARESKMSNGPIDFSLGTGYESKVLVEIKKSTNRLMHGYEEQIKKYATGEKACHSFYVVLTIKEQKATKNKLLTDIEILKNRYEENKKKGIITPEVIFIDGLIYDSPSK